MSYPVHLLEQARHLANREKKKPRQASLRRAVSTAYYALFHLLVLEATLNWKRAEQRALLARFFEHGKMKAACHKQRTECERYLKSNPQPGPELQFMGCLYKVTDTFIQSQQQRHSADYDNSKNWARSDVHSLLDRLDEAFDSWRAIRMDDDAQAFLIALLGNPRGL